MLKRAIVLGILLALFGMNIVSPLAAQSPAALEQRVIVLFEASDKALGSAEQMRALQQGHLANIRAMARDGILYVAGPITSASNDHAIRGILMFGEPTTELVQRIERHLANDPMVMAGYFVPRIRTLYFERGASLDRPVGQ